MPRSVPGDIAYFEVLPLLLSEAPEPLVVPVVPVVPEVDEPVVDGVPDAPDVSPDDDPGAGIVELLEPLGLGMEVPPAPAP